MDRLTEIADGVLAGTSELYVTTTTVLAGRDGGCLVIDPAVTPSDLTDLTAGLAARGLRPAAGWSTHPHWDHVLWSRDLGDVPRFASPRAAAAGTDDRQTGSSYASRDAHWPAAGLLDIVRLKRRPPIRRIRAR
jgi:glyoxylase-like metal-dependent hydrolase (beta-lactamase superfamily II)